MISDIQKNTEIVYKRIKAKREELGMSQTDLAKIVGYSDKTMISKIERGIIDLPLPKLNSIANALQISPAYLLGWDDMPEIKEVRKLDATVAINDVYTLSKYKNMTDADQEMLDSYLQLSEDKKKIIRDLVASLMN